MVSALLCLLLLPLSQAATADNRVDCYPEGGATESACEARDCTWEAPQNGDPAGVPECFMKTEKIGYTGARDGDSIVLTKNSGPKSPWGADLTTVRFRSSDIGNGVINIKIGPDDTSNVFDPTSMLNFPRETVSSSSSLSVSTDIKNDPFSFLVQRNDGTIIFDTSGGGLIFAEKFIQIVAAVPTDRMYGWGENTHFTLKHDFTRYSPWGMFARDQAPDSTNYNTKNLYGVHPFYLLVEPSGNAHGVFFFSTNAQEVITLPSLSIVYRTIGGLLDVYFFPGPSPTDVINQYLAFVGRPFMVPYWALGYQLCRWGYKNLDDMKTRVAAVRDKQIPLDIVYADIDYMDAKKDFTIDPSGWAGFGDYITDLKSQGMHSILIFDPAIEVDYDPFQRGIDANASFIEWETADQVIHDVQDQYPMAKDTLIVLANVWPYKNVAFPDFLDTTSKTDDWWSNEFKIFHGTIPFDGAWIDMNEPSVFDTYHSDTSDGSNHLRCPKTGNYASWDNPPYETEAVYIHGQGSFLAQSTLCMNGMTARRSQRVYDTKNLYGWSEARSTQRAVESASGKRGAVISRSTYASSGRYGGHWLGDNTSKFNDLRTSIIGVMEFNIFGIPYVGSDVCGFNGNTTEELCLRWQQMGSFHSFFRNHNSINMIPQDPAVWDSVAAATKKANEFRYQYLPYLYHLHYRASVYGDPVIRPIFFEYPTDAKTFTLDYQYMWGPSILVAPATDEGQTSVTVYIPTSDYYSIYESNYGQNVKQGSNSYPAPLTYNIPTFVRAGRIIPRHQTSALTTTALRAVPFSPLIVPDANNAASGEMYWDDGETKVTDWSSLDYGVISFNYSLRGSQTILVINTTKGTGNAVKIAQLEIFNYPFAPDLSSFTLNGKTLSVNTQKSSYSSSTRILNVVFSSTIDVSSAGVYNIIWRN